MDTAAEPLPLALRATPGGRALKGLAGIDVRYVFAQLTLGLLAVPGSMVAWDLPSGGLYTIGLPLAIAAIVVGLRARRQGVGKGRATTGMVLGALCIAQMVIWTAVSLV